MFQNDPLKTVRGVDYINLIPYNATRPVTGTGQLPDSALPIT